MSSNDTQDRDIKLKVVQSMWKIQSCGKYGDELFWERAELILEEQSIKTESGSIKIARDLNNNPALLEEFDTHLKECSNCSYFLYKAIEITRETIPFKDDALPGIYNNGLDHLNDLIKKEKLKTFPKKNNIVAKFNKNKVETLTRMAAETREATEIFQGKANGILIDKDSSKGLIAECWATIRHKEGVEGKLTLSGSREEEGNYTGLFENLQNIISNRLKNCIQLIPWKLKDYDIDCEVNYPENIIAESVESFSLAIIMSICFGIISVEKNNYAFTGKVNPEGELKNINSEIGKIKRDVAKANGMNLVLPASAYDEEKLPEESGLFFCRDLEEIYKEIGISNKVDEYLELVNSQKKEGSQNIFSNGEVAETENTNLQTNDEPIKKRRSFFIIIYSFLVLLLILLITIYYQINNPAEKTKLIQDTKKEDVVVEKTTEDPDVLKYYLNHEFPNLIDKHNIRAKNIERFLYTVKEYLKLNGQLDIQTLRDIDYGLDVSLGFCSDIKEIESRMELIDKIKATRNEFHKVISEISRNE